MNAERRVAAVEPTKLEARKIGTVIGLLCWHLISWTARGVSESMLVAVVPEVCHGAVKSDFARLSFVDGGAVRCRGVSVSIKKRGEN
jgi:hypothetical protein